MGLNGYLPYKLSLLSTSRTVLRKQARSLENEIDLKLVAFSKIGAGSGGGGSGGLGGVDTSPLLGEHVFDSLSEEIEQMLEKVRYVTQCHAMVQGLNPKQCSADSLFIY